MNASTLLACSVVRCSCSLSPFLLHEANSWYGSCHVTLCTNSSCGTFRVIRTISGERLIVGYHNQLVSVAFPDSGAHAVADVPLGQWDSCAEGSVILSISDMLKDSSFPAAALPDSDNVGIPTPMRETATTDLEDPELNTSGTTTPPLLWFLIPGFLWVLACGCGVWFLRHTCCLRRPHASSAANNKTLDSPEARSLIPMPKVCVAALRCTSRARLCPACFWPIIASCRVLAP